MEKTIETQHGSVSFLTNEKKIYKESFFCNDYPVSEEEYKTLLRRALQCHSSKQEILIEGDIKIYRLQCLWQIE